ncbi:MAG: CoA-binding protein [Desulfovibrio sp.]|nr:CoA-binding protein [Desulfovibrio sp.]
MPTAAKPDGNVLRSLFERVRSIAIVGAKDVAGQPVDRVGRYLIREGFEVFPVHPKRTGVWRLDTCRSLLALPKAVDLVVLFRAGLFCPAHADEVLRMTHKPVCFWMQEGIRSEDARKLLEPAGVMVVEDACVMVEHARIFDKSVIH